MRKNLLLLLLPVAACSLNEPGPRPEQDISGDYNTDVHYRHTWAVSKNNYGTSLDTGYASPFHIAYDHDTIKLSYNSYNGTALTDRLLYIKAQSGTDTLRFNGLYGYLPVNASLIFYKSTGRFRYIHKEQSNPSSGGNSITYTIDSR